MLDTCYAFRQHFHSAFDLFWPRFTLLVFLVSYFLLKIVCSLKSLAVEKSYHHLLKEMEAIHQYFQSLFDLLTAILINFTPSLSELFSSKNFPLRSLTQNF